MPTPSFSTIAIFIALPASLATIGYMTFAAPATGGPAAIVSQKGRMFSMSSISIDTGETVRIVNDDADLQHHAYIDSNTFKFDSGDQEPGSKTDIRFPISGVFTVQCGIHPKMRMTVTVK